MGRGSGGEGGWFNFLEGVSWVVGTARWRG